MIFNPDNAYEDNINLTIREIIDASFSYDDEKGTRESIKHFTDLNLKEAETGYDRKVLIDAYDRMCKMSFREIEDLFEKINGIDDDDFEDDEDDEANDEDEYVELDASDYKDVIYDHWHNDQLRDKLLSFENGDDGYFYIHDENNDGKGYGIKAKVKYENDYYFLLLYIIELSKPREGRAVVCTFYKLEMAENPIDDRLIRVKDDELKDKLEKLANEICDSSDD